MATQNKRATVLLPHQIANLNAGQLVHYCDAVGVSADPTVNTLLEWILCNENRLESAMEDGESYLSDLESELIEREMNLDAEVEEKTDAAIRDCFAYVRNIRELVEDYFHADKNMDEDTLDQLLNEIEDCEFSIPSKVKKVAPPAAPKRPGAKMVALPVIMKIVRAAKTPTSTREIVALAAAQQISRSAAYASIKAAISSGLLASEHGLIRPKTM